MATRTMTKLIYRLLFIELFFSLFLFIQGYWYWLLNFQLAFVSSLLIILGSFHSYKRMVNKRIEAGESQDDALLEKLEDPHGLYEEDLDEGQNLDQDLDLKAVVKEEKERLKAEKQSFKKTLKTTPALFSPLRFAPYIFLVLSFIGLNNNHILDIPAFLIGLGAGITAAVVLGKAWIVSTNP